MVQLYCDFLLGLLLCPKRQTLCLRVWGRMQKSQNSIESNFIDDHKRNLKYINTRPLKKEYSFNCYQQYSLSSPIICCNPWLFDYYRCNKQRVVTLIFYNYMTEDVVEQSKGKIDLIVIGNPNSGKTSLIRRFIDGQSISLSTAASFTQFYTPTLGLTLQKKVINVNGQEVTVCIWDTAGQEKFFSLTKNYFKKADGVLVVFDLTDKVSFQKVDKFWMPEIKEKSDENCGQILIGNKKDMGGERVVPIQSAKSLSEELNIPYFETSAKTGDGVEQAIVHLIKDCLSRVKNEQQSGVQLKVNPDNKSSCTASFRDFFRDVKARFA